MASVKASGAVLALEKAHEMAMSDDADVAASGRLQKLLINASEQWMRGEIERLEDEPRVRLAAMITASIEGAVGLIASTTWTVCHGPPPQAMLDDIASGITEAIRSIGTRCKRPEDADA